ncbi:hypothetical protein BKM04_02710 [Pseudomonas syringae pv. syringae]|nr:hypothetical protein BKM04_02710 [Pseudomonas syringae pv. syringae]POD67761.1 hypothetical protein BKM06_02710 [Pseudomonas syringae pv. syringae]
MQLIDLSTDRLKLVERCVPLLFSVINLQMGKIFHARQVIQQRKSLLLVLELQCLQVLLEF